MTTKRRQAAVRRVVANPRALPAGAWIIRIGERRWYEGDDYDGPLDERFVRDGFVREMNDG